MNYKILLILCLFYGHIGLAQSSHWQSFPAFQPNNVVRTIVADTANHALYIAGNFNSGIGTYARVVKFHNNHFSDLPQAPIGVCLNGLFFDNELYICGIGPTILIKFNGISWDTISKSDAVIGLNYWNGKLVANGIFDSVGNYAAENCAYYDGQHWQNMFGYGNATNASYANYIFYTMAGYNGQIYLGGNFNEPSRSGFKGIIRYDGQQWTDVGGGIQGDGFAIVAKLLEWRGDLYVSGRFFERNGSPGNCIARWDGSQWHRLGNAATSNATQQINDMIVFKDELWVFGVTEVEGLPTNGYIAKWDGSRWCTFSDTFDVGYITNLQVLDDELYIGGNFKSINGDTSFNGFAKWIGGNHTYQCSNPVKEEIINSPASSIVLFPNPAKKSIRIIASKVKEVKVYDALGRPQNVAFKNPEKTEIDISNLAAGIYTVMVQTKDGNMALKFLKEE